MGFSEEISRLRSEFRKAKSEIKELKEKINCIRSDSGPDENQIAETNKCNERIAELNSTKENIAAYRKIAAEHTVGRPLGNEEMLEPDMDRLFELEQSSSDNYRATGVYTYADLIISLCKSYTAFIDDQIAKNERRKASISDCRNAAVHQAEQDCIREGDKIEARLRALIDSPEICKLAADINDTVNLYNITPELLVSPNGFRTDLPMMLIGGNNYPVEAPKALYPALKKRFGNAFNEHTGSVFCPRGFRSEAGSYISAEYTEENSGEVYSGLQALILNQLRLYGAASLRVSVIDRVHYNASAVSELYYFTEGKNNLIDNIPQTADECNRYIQQLESYYHTTDAKLGSLDIRSFNSANSENRRIPFRIVIVISEHNAQSGTFSYLRNNLARFGLVLIELSLVNRGSMGVGAEKKLTSTQKNCFQIICDDSGAFHTLCGDEIMPFTWHGCSIKIPKEFSDSIIAALNPKQIGSKYFDRYKMKAPSRRTGKRASISVPFAINDDDETIFCNFENENFAAYMMGASRSGKSSLLHTMISGFMMNYHPDELELWLADFKMVEFKQYTDPVPPHVKYVLLENSQELVFDLIDKLTEQLERRKMFFAQNGYQNINDIPPEVRIPVILVIIDEFAQMAQVLKLGYKNGISYATMFENLFLQGGGVGLKFILASQSYSEGLPGLTDAAREQIQMRFALKNTYNEIKATLMLPSEYITAQISGWMNNMQPYYTLYKRRGEDGTAELGKFRNMYVESSQIKELIKFLDQQLKPTDDYDSRNDSQYFAKKPVVVDGMTPKTFKDQEPARKAFEEANSITEYDTVIYPGVPRSLDSVFPFFLKKSSAENILLVGGEPEERVSVMMSILDSYARSDRQIWVWADPSSRLFQKYRKQVWDRFDCAVGTDEICRRITEIGSRVKEKKTLSQLIIVLDYELIASEMSDIEENPPQPEPAKVMSLDDIKAVTDPDERRRLIKLYNEQVAEYNKSLNDVPAFDARGSFKQLLSNAPKMDTHFLFSFEQARDMRDSGIDNGNFVHRMAFALSKDEKYMVLGSGEFPRIDKGVFLYTDSKRAVTMHPHLQPGVPLGLWKLDKNGKPVANLGGF